MSQRKKTDYELADELLNRLKKEKVDTIIFYKRTCIDCCDFFNILWLSKGKKFLHKIYYDFDKQETYSGTLDLKEDKIFEQLNLSYTDLKIHPLKGNGHRQRHGSLITITHWMDHYCYTEVHIYTQQDSIIADEMKDHDFDKYTAFGADTVNNKERNDNYLENTNSKWNTWLSIIETELANMPETSDGEFKTLRTRK